eukprot:scaffold32667_cov45-Phaeocystis_antarctica.AAC.4
MARCRTGPDSPACTKPSARGRACPTRHRAPCPPVVVVAAVRAACESCSASYSTTAHLVGGQARVRLDDLRPLKLAEVRVG